MGSLSSTARSLPALPLIRLSARRFGHAPWQVGAHITELHDRLMRAVDDIKESVRKAALAAWRALSSVINRLADGSLAPAEQVIAAKNAAEEH